MTKSKCSTKKPKPPPTEWTTKAREGSNKGPYPPDTSDLQRRIKENPPQRRRGGPVLARHGPEGLPP